MPKPARPKINPGRLDAQGFVWFQEAIDAAIDAAYEAGLSGSQEPITLPPLKVSAATAGADVQAMQDGLVALGKQAYQAGYADRPAE